jgi:hypothetical protein
MKIAMFTHHGRSRLGIVEGEFVIDVLNGLPEFPTDLLAWLPGGESSWKALLALVDADTRRLPFCTSLSRLPLMFARPRSTAAVETSTIVTSSPACAQIWAIPLPIVPAPMTATCLMFMICSSFEVDGRCVSGRCQSVTAIYMLRRYWPPTSNRALVICPREHTRTASISTSKTLRLSIAASCSRLSMAGASFALRA